MTRRALRLLPLLPLLLLASGGSARATDPPAGLRNLGFEEGAAGDKPPGWELTERSATAGYTLATSDERPAEGKRAAVLSPGPPPTSPFARGALRQSLDATPYRGKRLRLRASVRTDGADNGTAQVFLGVDRPGFSGLVDSTSEPSTSREWTPAQAIADVPADASKVNLGLQMTGPGRAFLDAVSLEVVGEAGAGNEGPRPLSARGLDNLVAFSRLLGLVRFFHPSDPAAAADWQQLALAGVQRAERAKTAAELARALEAIFRPVAPTLRVAAGRRPTLPPALAAGPAGATVTAWEHRGVKLGQGPSIYRSERIAVPPAAPPGELPSPGKPLVVDLGGGVTALVPLALYRDDRGTLPRVAAGVHPPAPEKPEAFLLSGNDRATRLADVALAWTVFEHFYPYFDVPYVGVVGTDWNAELPRALSAAATDTGEIAFLATLRRLVAALHDGHGGVYFAREVASHGLPLVWGWIEDQLVITRVAPAAGSSGASEPASPAGLAAGDVVLTLDGRPAAEVLAEREATISGATPQWRRFRALGSLLWGAEGEEVRLTVRNPDGRVEPITARRTLPRTAQLDESRPEKIAEVRPGIFYVDIDRIDDADFKGALDRLAAARGIVFDLRGYPGHLTTIVLAHLTDVPVTSARWNVPIVTQPDHPGLRFAFSNWSVEPEKPRLTAKVAFLIDGRAISYAETYLGIVENYHLAALVGSPTAGTNGNVNPFLLPGGYNVTWTGMKVLKHDGSRHHGVGILPTVPVNRTIQGVAAGRDEILDKGIEVVSVTAAAGLS